MQRNSIQSQKGKSQTLRATYYINSLYEIFRIGKSTETERLVVAPSWVGRRIGMTVDG